MGEPNISRRTRYHRRLEHGDFSLEANNDRAPEPGFFYLLRDDEVLLRTDELSVANEAYKGLCRAHWENHLDSDSVPRRISSAWGLLGIDSKHLEAAAVIERDGTVHDRQRLVSIRNRERALHARQARMTGPVKR